MYLGGYPILKWVAYIKIIIIQLIKKVREIFIILISMNSCQQGSIVMYISEFHAYSVIIKRLSEACPT